MLLSNGQGILLDSMEPEERAEAIVKVCGFSEQQWSTLSNAAHAAATSYTWEDATDRFEQALGEARERSW